MLNLTFSGTQKIPFLEVEEKKRRGRIFAKIIATNWLRARYYDNQQNDITQQNDIKQNNIDQADTEQSRK